MSNPPEGDQEATGDEGEGRRRLCQACFRVLAQHRCQSCQRFVCDDCVAPPREADREEALDEEEFLEDFLQASLTRCRACRDDEVRLPDLEVNLRTIEGI